LDNKSLIEVGNDHLLLDQYLQNLSRLNKSAHTIKNYRADLIKFFDWLLHVEKLPIEKVNGEIISRYKDFLDRGGDVYSETLKNPTIAYFLWFQLAIARTFFKKKIQKSLLFYQGPLSVSSRRRHLSSLKNFFQYLKEGHEDTSGAFAKNPVKSKIHAITLKEIDVTPTKMLSRENFAIIENKTYRTNERLMIYLLYYGGFRLSELCYLKISDFDQKTKTITFNRKGGYVHTLAIQKEDLIFKNLNFYLNSTNFKSDFLFQNKEGRPFSLKAFYNKIMKILERAELIESGITPHSFRKACATNLYIRTKDLLYVRDYLNHSDAKVTQTYIDRATLGQLRKRLH
jgi:integrase/recombinase XerD